jgi:hypothetical protein
MGAPFGACRKEQKDQRFCRKERKEEKSFFTLLLLSARAESAWISSD